PIPLADIDWRPTRPPVDIDLWPEPEAEPACFTSIASWDNRGKDIEYDGSTYFWSKHVNFMRFIDCPGLRPETWFRMASRPPKEDIRHEAEGNGWPLIDPRPIWADMDTY